VKNTRLVVCVCDGAERILHVCRSLLWFSRATRADEIVNLHCITSWVILLLLCAVLQQPTKGGKCFYLRLYARSRIRKTNTPRESSTAYIIVTQSGRDRGVAYYSAGLSDFGARREYIIIICMCTMTR